MFDLPDQKEHRKRQYYASPGGIMNTTLINYHGFHPVTGAVPSSVTETNSKQGTGSFWKQKLRCNENAKTRETVSIII